jgi:membrane fusion protein, multidrug efflux system
VTHDPKGQATTLVVGADNKVAIHTLQLRGTSGNQWIVEGGLEDGDRVIVSGVQKVQPGAVVQAVESTTATTTGGAPAPSVATPGAAALPAPMAATAAAAASPAPIAATPAAVTATAPAPPSTVVSKTK